ncbi:MAG: TonB-dependent receptor, partial [Alphaproteobacteria bacterium]
LPTYAGAHASNDDELNITIYKERLAATRNNLSPQTGTSAYTIDSKAIHAMPLGNNTSLDEVLEHAPGVAQDSFGQFHLRGEHSNLQYRLNGILLPEGITGFGQVLDSSIIERSTLLTGALPAQYGYRTAGIVDIQTKTGFENAGEFSVQTGSFGTIEPSIQYGGVSGNAHYFFSANHLSSDLGIEAPTGARKTIHDHTEQDKQFGYISYMINPMQRLELIAGNTIGHFELPNTPGLTQNFTLSGTPTFDSASLNEKQFESNQYATVAWQGQRGDLEVQLAPYIRNSHLHFQPDPIGDLIFNGVASDVKRNDLAIGLQGDGSWKANSHHTLRSGFSVQQEYAGTDNTSQVFDVSGGIPMTTPRTIIDNSRKEGQLYGLYLQDEWKLTGDLTLNYGARFDVVAAYVQESQLSPRLGISYRATPSTTLHAGYARYFTPPAIELISSSSISKFDDTTNEAPNPTQNDAVKSERSHSFDVGISQKITDHFQIGLDGYYKIVKNMLDEGQFGQALVFTPFNYEHGNVYGVEFSASYEAKDLQAYGNLAVSRAVAKNITSAQFNFDPDELAYINDNFVHVDHDQTYTASAGVSYQVLPTTTLNMDGFLGSGLRKGFANTESLPLYTRIDAGITHELDLLPKDKTSLRFSVINLFDNIYQLRDGSGIGVGAAQFGPRRGFYLGLSQTF